MKLPALGEAVCPHYLDKHLAASRVVARTDRCAIDGHGLAITGKLQGVFFLHQLLDYL